MALLQVPFVVKNCDQFGCSCNVQAVGLIAVAFTLHNFVAHGNLWTLQSAVQVYPDIKQVGDLEILLYLTVVLGGRPQTSKGRPHESWVAKNSL